MKKNINSSNLVTTQNFEIWLSSKSYTSLQQLKFNILYSLLRYFAHFSENGYTFQMSSKVMYYYIGDYVFYINELVDNNIIIYRDNKYCVDGYMNQQGFSKHIQLSSDFDLSQPSVNKPTGDSIAALNYNKKIFYSKYNTSICSNSLETNNLYNINNQQVIKNNIDNQRVINSKNRNYFIYSLENDFIIENELGDHNFQFKVTNSADNFGNRLHTSVTLLNKKYVPFIKHKDGSNLVELDWKNSQPYFITNLYYKNIQKYCLGTSKHFKSISKQLDLLITELNESKFAEYLTTGMIYEYIVKLLNIQEKDGLSAREIAKRILTRGFYRKDTTFASDYISTSDRKILEKDLRVLLEIKNLINSIVIDNIKLKTTFCYLLQRFENGILLEGKVGDYFRNNNISVITKHDCFIVKKQDADKILEDIFNIFESANLTKPSIKKNLLF